MARTRQWATRLTFAVATAWLIATNASRADPVADFYRGRTINLYISINVGGSYDIQARIIARHIARHIPGNPTIVPQNMVGAGGLTMANFLATSAPRDGTALGMMANTLVPFQAVQAPGVRFDAGKMQWVGTIDRPPNILVARAGSGLEAAADIRRIETTIAASARGAITYTIPSMLNEYAGAKFRIVTGYQGSANMNLALERGEVDAVVNSWPALKTTKAEWFSNNAAKVLAHTGTRHPDIAHLPTVQSLALRDEDRQVMDLVFAGDQFGHPLAFPEGVPAERVGALREAFQTILRDPAFRDEVVRAGYDVDPLRGEELQAMVARVLSAPAPVAARAKPIIAP